MIWNYSPHENNLDLLKRHLETKVSKIIVQGTSILTVFAEVKTIFTNK